MQMKTFHFIERIGSKITRTGTVSAPNMDGFPKTSPEAQIELLDSPSTVTLPAYWDQARKAPVALPDRPSPAHQFNYQVLKWVPDTQLAWGLVRSERNKKMADSDWSMLPDVSMSPERKQAWVEYRQQLRDITNQPDPTNIVWPKAPS